MSSLFKQPVDIFSHGVLTAQQNSLEWTGLTPSILMTETMGLYSSKSSHVSSITCAFFFSHTFYNRAWSRLANSFWTAGRIFYIQFFQEIVGPNKILHSITPQYYNHSIKGICFVSEYVCICLYILMYEPMCMGAYVCGCLCMWVCTYM